jgi:asparagine synthase (glutamine-hydrolysing)
MFRAPLGSFFNREVPPYVDQLLSEESLRKAGYFDVAAVQRWVAAHKSGRLSLRQRSSVELGLVAVTSTQLWHHLYIDHSLADI